jgi:hypothetical protein
MSLSIFLFIAAIFVASVNGAEHMELAGRACYSAVTFDPSLPTASVYAPSTGTILGISADYVSGGVTCDYRAYPLTKWGCTISGGWIMVGLYKADGRVLYYPTGATAGYSSLGSNGYSLSGQTYDTNPLELRSPSYAVTLGEQFFFAYTESFKATSTGDNQGEACADIYFIYDGPATPIHNRCNALNVDFFLGDCSTAYPALAGTVGLNTGRSTTNEGAIRGVDGRLSTAEGTISSNTGGIGTNAGAITALDDRLTTTEDTLRVLVTDLADLTGAAAQAVAANAIEDETVLSLSEAEAGEAGQAGSSWQSVIVAASVVANILSFAVIAYLWFSVRWLRAKMSGEGGKIVHYSTVTLDSDSQIESDA